MRFINAVLLAATLALSSVAGYAQAAISTNGTVATTIWNGITIPVILNTPITVQGQTLILTTNQTGGYIVTTYGPAGTNAFTPPSNTSGAAAFVAQAINNNNPANIGYYSTNGEWDVKLGAAYSQNSGQAAALLAIARYGFFKSAPNIGGEIGVLEGNQNGQNGTAGAYACLDYRHPIGDAAFVGGLGGAYDVLTGKPGGIAKIGAEYRFNPHLSSWADFAYDVEGFGKTKLETGQTISDPSGLLITGGLSYCF